jgi:phage-related minor tail protein
MHAVVVTRTIRTMLVNSREIVACARIVRRAHGEAALDRIARYRQQLLLEGNERAAAIWQRVMDVLRQPEAETQPHALQPAEG